MYFLLIFLLVCTATWGLVFGLSKTSECQSFTLAWEEHKLCFLLVLQ